VTPGRLPSCGSRRKKSRTPTAKKLRTRRHLFQPLTPYGFGPVTFVMIVASAVVFWLSNFGTNPGAVMSLFMTDYGNDLFNGTLPEIRHGQVWRLFTPIFYHYGLMHIVFTCFGCAIWEV